MKGLTHLEIPPKIGGEVMSYGLAVSYRANQPFIFGAKQKADLSDSFFHNELRKYKLETKTPKEKKRICF